MAGGPPERDRTSGASAMPMDASEIERLIKSRIPGRRGDDPRSRRRRRSLCRDRDRRVVPRQVARPAAPDRLRGAEGPDGRQRCMRSRCRPAFRKPDARVISKSAPSSVRSRRRDAIMRHGSVRRAALLGPEHDHGGGSIHIAERRQDAHPGRRDQDHRNLEPRHAGRRFRVRRRHARHRSQDQHAWSRATRRASGRASST